MQRSREERERKILVLHRSLQGPSLSNGSEVWQILYGIPLPPSQVQRLGQLGKKLGPRSVSVLVDHASQLQPLRAFKEIAGFGIGLYVKIDTGYHRAGLTANSPELKALISSICNEIEPPGYADLHGFYSHAGHSYGADSASAAMAILIEEIHGLESVADVANSMNMAKEVKGRYVLSVGATPTATSAQNLHLEPGIGQPKSVDENMKSLKDCLRHVGTKHTTEIHAGVYPILDMQQLATRGSPTARMTKSLESQQELSTADLALSVLAEVASLYESRDSPEALIAAGSLALGREPCKSSSGWGTVSDWGMSSRKITGRSGWQVGRISQEHGILTKDPSANGDVAHLSIGQKVRIWPNHACVAGAGFGWYLVVDSSLAPDRQDEVVDVWVRCRGW